MSNHGEQLLHNIYLFKDLAEKEMQLVEAVAKVEQHGPGEEIFSEGDDAVSLYVIRHGSVKISRSENGEIMTITTLGTGSHFGEMAFLDAEKRSATVTAVEPTELSRIYFQDLRKVMDANPGIAIKVYRSLALFLCGRLRVTTTDLSFVREKNLRHF